MKDKMTQFNPLKISLANQNLIEASAGTGKTYNITFLFLRLIVEQKFNIEKILVVTFTEAATAELKSEIRKRLKQALEAFNPSWNEDEIVKTFVSSLKNKAKAKQQIQIAIRDFDQASIFTIHGFCRRMLKENAFESGSQFDMELVEDQESLLAEITADFWAKNVYFETKIFVSYLDQQKVTPETLLPFAKKIANRPDLDFIGGKTEGGESKLIKGYKKAKESLGDNRIEIETLISSTPGKAKKIYHKTNLPKWLNQAQEFLKHDEATMLPSRDGKKKDGVFHFTNEILSEKTDVTNHTFFDACSLLMAAHDELNDKLLWFKKNMATYVKKELSLRNTEQSVESFNDLLHKLHNALTKGEKREQLKNIITLKFKAALIDEFQDTDKIQYEIFSTIFAQTNYPFFLIGDPKQSIYAFRGGDIFTYLEAAQQAGSNVYSLYTNWRSDPGLVKAVNKIFSNAKNPFLFEKINFNEVTPKPNHQNSFKIDNKQCPPFQIQLVKLNEQNKTKSKKDIKIRATWSGFLDLVASDMALLLNSNSTIDNIKKIEPSDIAVLVQNKTQAASIKDALKKHKIASVISSDRSVYSTQAAQELCQVLKAISQPYNVGLVKAGLSTVLFGFNANDVFKLSKDDDLWSRWSLYLAGFREIWNKQGFIQMMKKLLAFKNENSDENIESQILKSSNGDRIITDIMHLAQLLQDKSSDARTTIEGLIAWFEQNISSDVNSDKDTQIRLESDDNAVSIVTIHKSKGLQYPVVYLPFLWKGSLRNAKDKEIIFHDKKNKNKVTIDLGTLDRHDAVEASTEEEIAENMRLLYVALTRAQHLCKVSFGVFNKFENSSLAFLLCNQDKELTINQLFGKIKKMSEEDVIKTIKTLFSDATEDVLVYEMIDSQILASHSIDPLEKNATFRTFNSTIKAPWTISSFSSISSEYGSSYKNYEEKELSFDNPSNELTSINTVTSESILCQNFPFGTTAGSCLHEIYEELDFSKNNDEVFLEIVNKKLDKFAIDKTQWGNGVVDWINDTLNTELDSELKGLTLSKISCAQRLNELEFLLPIEKTPMINSHSIASALKIGDTIYSDNYVDSVEKLNFGQLKGFLKGFIDLIFEWKGKWYLIDYKSNYLGANYSDYKNEFLNKEMAKHHYYLQYHLYSVALHRYLKYKIKNYNYKEHFGKVYYLFIRGMGKTHNYNFGVFKDRPVQNRIEKLSKLFGAEPMGF